MSRTKVIDEYAFDEDTLFEKTEDGTNEYWGRVYEFWHSVKGRFVEDLTSNQVKWLDKIKESLEN